MTKKLLLCVAVLLVSFFIFCPIPFLNYFNHIAISFMAHGFSKATVQALNEDTNWFARYFSGPQKDEKMIAFFHEHHAEMEKLAHIVLTEGYCPPLLEKDPTHRCGVIERRLGMLAGFGGSSFSNSALRTSKQQICGTQCYSVSMQNVSQEPQQWQGTKHSDIIAWQKSYLYVPPLYPAQYFGLNPQQFPSDPVAAISEHAYIKPSLNSIPKELNSQPEGYKDRAVRHIQDGWFIVLSPIVQH